MSDIEKQFFEAFNLIIYRLISKYNKHITYGPFDSLEDINLIVKGSMKGFTVEEVCPEITDRILLKLICLMGNTDYFLITNEGLPINIEGLKDSVLHSLTIYSKFHKGLKEEVQAIFKEQ